MGHAHCKYRRKRLISIVSIFVIRQKLLTLSAVRKLIFPSAALERRERQGLKVDETDLPVCRTYIDAIIGKGASVVTKSKWNNTVVVEVVDTTLIEQIARLPFVTKTKKVWTSPDSIPARNPERRKEVTNKFSKTDNYYGQAYRQIAVHRGDSLHAAGFKGEGMQIAVIDAGFIMPTR